MALGAVHALAQCMLDEWTPACRWHMRSEGGRQAHPALHAPLPPEAGAGSGRPHSHHWLALLDEGPRRRAGAVKGEGAWYTCIWTTCGATPVLSEAIMRAPLTAVLNVARINMLGGAARGTAWLGKGVRGRQWCHLISWWRSCHESCRSAAQVYFMPHTDIDPPIC